LRPFGHHLDLFENAPQSGALTDDVAEGERLADFLADSPLLE
jgi:hypothetical protein